MLQDPYPSILADSLGEPKRDTLLPLDIAVPDSLRKGHSAKPDLGLVPAAAAPRGRLPTTSPRFPAGSLDCRCSRPSSTQSPP